MPVKDDADKKAIKRKKGQAPTCSLARKQVAKRAKGAPNKSKLEKFEENLAAGETVDVDISTNFDAIDPNAANEKINDDEISSSSFLPLN